MVAGIVAVTTAVGTAVAAQHVVDSNNGTLYLSTTASTVDTRNTTSSTSTIPGPSEGATASPTTSGHRAGSTSAGQLAADRLAAQKATASRAAQRKAAAQKAATQNPSAHQPKAATSGGSRIRFGVSYSGDGTFYGATGAGNCSYEAGGSLMVAAMNEADYENSQICGAYVTVRSGGKSVTVKIVDRCPECAVGDIDLSQEAFARLASASAGRIKITWTLESPPGLGPVAYKYKSGSTRFWCGIQIRDNRNPVRSLEVKVGDSWKSLVRQEYNYFLSADGSGCGNTIRVTDIYGNQLTDEGISISPDVIQRGHGQFGGPA